MKCSFSRLLYPKSMEEARSGSFTIALFYPRENVVDAHGNKLSSIKVVGYYLPTVEGLKVDLTGHWKKDAKYGLQFEMESYEEVIAPGRKGIISYLASGLIKGVGPKLAERIYSAFGENTLQVLDSDPDRLLSVPGISSKKSEQIRDSYLETRGARKLITLLAPLDISARRAMLLQKLLGPNAEFMLRSTPYAVYELGLIDFDVADQLGAMNGIDRAAPERVAAGQLHTLELAEQHGHLCLHKEKFVRESVKLLNMPELTRMRVAQQAFDMLKAGRLVLYQDYVYRPLAAKAEQDVAVRVRAMLTDIRLPYMGDLDEEIDRQQAEMGISLAEEQRHAVKTALTSPISIITGGPGTGKTLIQRVVLNIFSAKFPKANIVCCAPTGRAARRMRQSTGFPASTVHKALGLTAGDGNTLEELEFLEADLVLADEASMLDMVMTWYLFNALPPGCRLVLVGDADQLPSVGPGAVLSELIACGRIPVVKLDKVFRQDEGSRIAENAKLIRHNIVLNPEENLGDDFQFWPSPSFQQSAELLEKLYVEEVNRFGVDNVALLTPFRKKTDTGVRAMNERLRAIINPPAPDKQELMAGQRLYRVGDKVMQIKNTEDLSNGDVGYIRKITLADGNFSVEVDFGENRIVDYEDYEALNQLELAYASTVHKSQGSEYTSVLISVQSGHGRMLKRPLIYTAITRAKRRVQLVGDWAALVSAIQTADTERRNTLLALRVQAPA